MRVASKSSGERGKRRTERLDGGGEMEARKSDINHLSWMAVVKNVKFSRKETEEDEGVLLQLDGEFAVDAEKAGDGERRAGSEGSPE